jgi:hypothetical protein
MLSLAWCLSGVAFLAWLSIQFDFGNCIYPSRTFPYFTSGRLIAGSLIPFVLLYVAGLDKLLHRWNQRLPLIVLAVIIALVTASAFHLSAPAFASRHNLLHA